jgi:hypothetical protein
LRYIIVQYLTKINTIFSTPKIQMKLTFVLRFTLLTLFLTACSALERPTLGTATPRPPTPTPLLSPTPVWFPPTETSTPSALTAPTATPNLLPGLGAILYSDDFTNPQTWSDGTDTLRDGRLTLAASPGVYLMSLNQELFLSDFYAEITAHLSLCRGADEYGFLVRAASPTTYYRFTLDCNGEVKADRVLNSARVPLKTPFAAMDAPHGGPSEVTIAIWAVGREMRFFLNGHYQFTADDPALPSGTLGVFVRASEDSPITISFSDLIVRAVNPNQTTTP